MEEIIKLFDEIPIYFTYINDYNSKDLDSIKQSISVEIKKTMEDKSNGISLNNVYDKLHIIGPSYEIVEIDPSLKADVITNPIYAETFRQIQRLIEQGAKVNYVNLFAKEPNIMLSTYDPDDPSFWEKIFHI